jgi:hypothetical protein
MQFDPPEPTRCAFDEYGLDRTRGGVFNLRTMAPVSQAAGSRALA